MARSRMQFRQFAVTADAWTPLVAPMNCDYLCLYNDAAAPLTLRSDPDDVTTEKTLAAWAQEIVLCPVQAISTGPRFRFPENEPIFWMKALSGPVTVAATFIR